MWNEKSMNWIELDYVNTSRYLSYWITESSPEGERGRWVECLSVNLSENAVWVYWQISSEFDSKFMFYVQKWEYICMELKKYSIPVPMK